jgi:hypothetical protein
MKNRPRIGLAGELAFKIEPQHAIDFAGGGMPAVLSTPISSVSSNAPRATNASLSPAACTNAPSSARKVSAAA